MITLIAAMTKKNVIGKDGKILWKLQGEEKGLNWKNHYYGKVFL